MRFGLRAVVLLLLVVALAACDAEREQQVAEEGLLTIRHEDGGQCLPVFSNPYRAADYIRTLLISEAIQSGSPDFASAG